MYLEDEIQNERNSNFIPIEAYKDSPKDVKVIKILGRNRHLVFYIRDDGKIVREFYQLVDNNGVNRGDTKRSTQIKRDFTFVKTNWRPSNRGRSNYQIFFNADIDTDIPRGSSGYPLAHFIATYFVPNPNKYKYVLHKDGDRANCHADNLKWVEKMHECSSQLTTFETSNITYNLDSSILNQVGYYIVPKKCDLYEKYRKYLQCCAKRAIILSNLGKFFGFKYSTILVDNIDKVDLRDFYHKLTKEVRFYIQSDTKEHLLEDVKKLSSIKKVNDFETICSFPLASKEYKSIYTKLAENDCLNMNLPSILPYITLKEPEKECFVSRSFANDGTNLYVRIESESSFAVTKDLIKDDLGYKVFI